MTFRSFVVAIASCASTILSVAGTAEAITLPDTSSCSVSGSSCLTISNLSTGYGIVGSGGAGRGVVGNATSGFGVYGSSTSGTAVYAYSQSGTGIYSYGGGSNAVVGENQDSNESAAAVAGLAASSSGLAFYGTGGIIISGSHAQKQGGGSWSAPSDARIKKDVNTLRWGLEELRQVRPVTYRYNGLGGTTDDGRVYVGVIAQELETLFPSMVSSKKGKLRPSDTVDTDIRVVDPSAFTYVLINAVKEQQEIIERQGHRITSLERGRPSSLSASVVGGGVGMGLAVGLLPFAFAAWRRRKDSKPAS